jgi:amino acid transporter
MSAPAVAAKPNNPSRSMGIFSVAAIGIGAMVGAGIFALIGQAALAAGQKVWMSFLLGGVIALLSGYSFARLSTRYASADGALGYFNAAFSKRVAGTFSLIYVLTLLVAVAMVARAFGAYAERLFFDVSSHGVLIDVFAAGIIVALAILNMVSEGATGWVEMVLVGIKLVILSALTVAGIATFDPAMLDPHKAVSTMTMFGAIGLTFFAYAGYGTMANAGSAVENPGTTIPRAIFLAIGVTIVLYVGLSLVLLGNISPADLAKYADTAVAQAAKPIFGQIGFTMVSIAALLATASAINGTLFGALRIAGGMAKNGQFPDTFNVHVWRNWTGGILGCVVGVIVLAVAFNLSVIASAASLAFLVAYLGVHLAAWRLAPEIGANRAVVGLGVVSMLAVLVVFLLDLWENQPGAVWMAATVVVGSIVVQTALAADRRRTKS